MRRRALIAALPASLFVALVTAAAPAAPAQTPDQQLIASLETARAGARVAARSLARPTPTSIATARSRLKAAGGALAAASRVAPRAVGALETPTVQRALTRGSALLAQAQTDIAAGRHTRASEKALAALDLVNAAIREFGAPLEREFSAFAVDRDFRNIRGFANYSGLTATASEEVTEVVVGAANRETANAGEPEGPGVVGGDELPITVMSVYIIRDPIGRFTSNWCRLAQGLITCRLNPTLRPEHSYTIAFGPKLERGTKVLVKFKTRDGRRSFAVYTTR